MSLNNRPHTSPVETFVSFRPNIYDFLGGKSCLSNAPLPVSSEPHVSPLSCDGVPGKQSRGSTDGLLSRVYSILQRAENTFFSKHKIRANDEFLLVLFFFCSRAPQSVNCKVTNIKERHRLQIRVCYQSGLFRKDCYNLLQTGFTSIFYDFTTLRIVLTGNH